MSLGECLLPDSLVKLPKDEFVPEWKFRSLKRDALERIMGMTNESHGEGLALTEQEIFKRLVDNNIVSNSWRGKIKMYILLRSRFGGVDNPYFEKIRDTSGEIKYRIIEDYDPF